MKKIVIQYPISYFELLIIVTIVLGLSPIIKTLTLSYSEDTIIALVIFLFVIHLFTHDYSFINGYSNEFKFTISLNCIITVSILFASRLNSNLYSFGIVLLGIILFEMLPYFRHYLKTKSTKLYQLFTIVLYLFNNILLYNISTPIVIIYNLTCIVISFIVPLLLIYLLRYKEECFGKWDIIEF